MHIVIGKGNLGIDLKLALRAAGHKAVILTRSGGFEWPESYSHMVNLEPTHIWVTAGFGSVQECANNFSGALKTHTAMPLELARNLPIGIKLGLFSSDYVAHEEYLDQPRCYVEKPRSFYEMSKLWMEQGIENSGRPNTTVFRVCSLYGQHYPEKTFPGKLRAKFTTPTEISLPENEVVPTPTSWIAQTLVRHLDEAFTKRPEIYHIAPSGSTTTLEWGMRILDDQYTYKSKGFDPLRPFKSSLGCSFGKAPDWSVLWEQNKNYF